VSGFVYLVISKHRGAAEGRAENQKTKPDTIALFWTLDT